MIFMISVRNSFHAYSHRFVGFNNTSIFCLVFSNCATSFPVQTTLESTRHCCWHRNFQLSTSGIHCELEFFIVWFKEEYSSPLSGIVELWFPDSPSLLCFLFAVSDICFHTSGHTLSGREVDRFLVRSLPGPCVSVRWPFVQENESCGAGPCS